MRAFRGQTLLSLMVALAISCTLLFTVFHFFQFTHLGSYQHIAYLSLQQEVEGLLQLMEKDLRRTGFRGVQKHLSQTNWDYFTPSNDEQALSIGQKQGEMLQSCVVFFYDLDHSGCVGGKNRPTGESERYLSCVKNYRNTMQNVEKELFGYRLNRGSLQTRAMNKNEVNGECIKEECRSYLLPQGCNQGHWQTLIDEKHMIITALRFNLIERKALEIYLKAQRRHPPYLNYETRAVVVLPNQWG